MSIDNIDDLNRYLNEWYIKGQRDMRERFINALCPKGSEVDKESIREDFPIKTIHKVNS